MNSPITQSADRTWNFKIFHCAPQSRHAWYTGACAWHGARRPSQLFFWTDERETYFSTRQGDGGHRTAWLQRFSTSLWPYLVKYLPELCKNSNFPNIWILFLKKYLWYHFVSNFLTLFVTIDHSDSAWRAAKKLKLVLCKDALLRPLKWVLKILYYIIDPFLLSKVSQVAMLGSTFWWIIWLPVHEVLCQHLYIDRTLQKKGCWYISRI